MKRNIIILILISMIFTQSEQPYPPLDLVSIPTAGTLPKGAYTYETILSKGGSIMPRLAIGLTSSLTLGLSYGMHGIIGAEEPDFNPLPGFHVKYRMFDETNARPAFLLGINTQGTGVFTEINKFKIKKENGDIEIVEETYKRYEKKALGFFLSLSKNWDFFGNLGIHFGVNNNIWEKTANEADDGDFNYFIGLDKEINRSFSILFEYDAGLNDNQDKYDIHGLSFGEGKGFVNAGVRWTVVPNVLVELNFNDLRRNTSSLKFNSTKTFGTTVHLTPAFTKPKPLPNDNSANSYLS